MPRGRPKKVVEGEERIATEEELKTLEVAPVVEAPKPVEVKPEPAKPADPWAAAVAESRKLLDVPLSPGQAYFESPEGFIMIDESTRGRVWCRQADKGRGMWINPRR